MKTCIIKCDDRLFCREAVLKAAYQFLDQYYIHLSYAAEHEIAIEIKAKSGIEIDQIDSKFCNELIAQMVRYQLSASNKGMKELILGRALYSTCIDTEETNAEETSENQVEIPSLDSIAVDWFEQNETVDSL